MPPRRKVAVKAKTVPDMSHVTARRPTVNDIISDDQEDAKEVSIPQHNIENKSDVTVLLNKIPNIVLKDIYTESDLEDEETDRKLTKKKLAKGKSKLQKEKSDTNLKVPKLKGRASSVDRQTVKAVVKVVGSKNRKRPVDKDTKSISPVNEPSKRNRRAASVDVLPSENSSSSQVPKRNRRVAKDTVENENEIATKNNKKEEVKVLDKNTKDKKNIKKAIKIGLEPEINDVEPSDMVADESKPIQYVQKGLIYEEHVNEDEENEVEYRAKPTKSRRAPKSKSKHEKEEKKQKSALKSKKHLTPEKSEESIENDTDVLTMKQASKKIIKSSDSSKGSSDEIGDLEKLPKTPEMKPKRARKGKQTHDVEKEEKVVKPSIKRGGGRKVKVEDLEDEAKQMSPPESNDEEVFKTGDLPDVILDTPKSDQKIKPTATKRKPKPKSTKK